MTERAEAEKIVATPQIPVTLQEIELLASLLARAGVNQIEAMFANNVLNKLRALIEELAPAPETNTTLLDKVHKQEKEDEPITKS